MIDATFFKTKKDANEIISFLIDLDKLHIVKIQMYEGEKRKEIQEEKQEENVCTRVRSVTYNMTDGKISCLVIPE